MYENIRVAPPPPPHVHNFIIPQPPPPHPPPPPKKDELENSQSLCIRKYQSTPPPPPPGTAGSSWSCSLVLVKASTLSLSRGRLDLAVPFTPSTPNRQNRNQVCWNICAGVRRSTPYSEVA